MKVAIKVAAKVAVKVDVKVNFKVAAKVLQRCCKGAAKVLTTKEPCRYLTFVSAVAKGRRCCQVKNVNLN